MAKRNKVFIAKTTCLFFFYSRGPVFKGAFNANTEDIGVTRNFNSTPEARSA